MEFFMLLWYIVLSFLLLPLCVLTRTEISRCVIPVSKPWGKQPPAIEITVVTLHCRWACVSLLFKIKPVYSFIPFPFDVWCTLSVKAKRQCGNTGQILRKLNRISFSLLLIVDCFQSVHNSITNLVYFHVFGQ